MYLDKYNRLHKNDKLWWIIEHENTLYYEKCQTIDLVFFPWSTEHTITVQKVSPTCIIHIFSPSNFTRNQQLIHITYLAIFFHITCMTYIFHRKYISRIDQPNWNHIFLMYILFTRHFLRNQHLFNLNKATQKSITNLTCNIFNR